jgi:uncharacterized protein YbaR (Trm112 family)
MAHEQPIMRPDFVKGVVAEASSRVDRYFYLFDEESDLVFEADGFREPSDDGREQWMIIMMCPACHQHLTLKSSKKQFEVTSRGIETGEPIGCSYYLEDMDGYTGMCPFRAEFQPPKQLQYGEVRTQAGVVQVRIDARIRRA